MRTPTKSGFTFARGFMVAAPLLVVTAVWLRSYLRLEPAAAPPANVSGGLPHVVTSRWTLKPVSTWERARGLTARVWFDAWLTGDLNLPGRLWIDSARLGSARQTLYLTYRQGSHRRRLVTRDGTSGLRIGQIPSGEDVTGRPTAVWTVPKRHVRAEVLLPLASLPADATDLEVVGNVTLNWYENPRKRPFPARWKAYGEAQKAFWQFSASSKPLTVSLDSLEGPRVPPGTTAEVSGVPAVQVVKSCIRSAPRGGFENRQSGDALVALLVRVPQSRFHRQKRFSQIVESTVTDASGRIWLPGRSEWGSPQYNALGTELQSSFGLPGDEFLQQFHVPLWTVPASAGPLTLNVWLAVGPNEEPLLFKQEIRPAWLFKTTPHIRIQAVKFSKVRGAIANKPNGDAMLGWKHVVAVTFSCSLKKTAFPIGYVIPGMIRDRLWQPDDYVRNPQIDPAYDRGQGWRPDKPGPNQCGLIVNWSERLTDRRGALLPQDAPGEEPATSIQAEAPRHRAGTNLWTVRYAIDSWPKTKSPLWFRAAIGIEGEGFVPVSCPVVLN